MKATESHGNQHSSDRKGNAANKLSGSSKRSVNQMGDNPTVEHTSPEMQRAFKLLAKHSLQDSSGQRTAMKDVAMGMG